MKMNAGTWIGLIGGAIGIIVGITAVLTTTGSEGIYIAGGILVLFGGMFLLFYKLFFAEMFLANRLKKEGIPGKALIKEVHDTGVTINYNPQVRLVVEVKNSLGQLYTASLKTVVSRIQTQLYQPGMVIPVLIDPKDEQKMVIDFSGGSAGIQSNTSGNNSDINIAALKEEMMKLQQEGDSIRLTGKAARAIIKKYTWLGINVNGNNPYAEIEMEVMPDDAPAFTAVTKGAISEMSVPKYQPGQEVFVKYDINDKSRVTIEHS